MDERRYLVSTSRAYSGRHQLGLCLTNMSGFPLTTPSGLPMTERLTFAEALRLMETFLGGVPEAGPTERRRWAEYWAHGNLRL